MRILFATSEAVPYWKTGGLADVARALPDALAARGHEVRIAHPLYRPVRALGLPLEPAGTAKLPWPRGAVRVRYFLHRPRAGAPGLLIDEPAHFDTEQPYLPAGEDALAHGRRFALFCRAVAEHARAWSADVVHLNDWPTGLVPVYGTLDGPAVPTVFAIHNLAYQGNFPRKILRQIGVPRSFFRIDGLEFWGKASFLKAGLALSDHLVTVSPTYAREIQTEEYGAGMDGLLRHRRALLHGILNGLDTHAWDPSADRAIVAPYDADRVARKDRNRDELVHELGLDGAAPVVVMITRLAHQKGIDLLLDAVPGLIRRGVRLAVLGDGDARYEEALSRLVAAQPRCFAAFFRFDDALARRLYAGGDFFLMPSLYEPCGLGQMIAQRYGTPPIVRHTGGLVDTVQDGITGFAFRKPTARALLRAVDRARLAWRQRGWDELRRRCMRLDWSWTRSAAEYERVYHAALKSAGRPGSA
ncbi:MAG: glycogen synthase [Gemmatimonadetes bacterium]|nr:glycogen synthase [Gemmatimonadota bacterium]